ncbi:MAG: sulfotransferase [Chitinophagales bacterium]
MTPNSPLLSHNSLFPNLFIVGAAKSGTTALHYALDQHPQVYMSKKKEPGYFVWPEEELQFINNGKLITQPRFLVNHLDDYLKLFEVGTEKKIRGESSTTYLFFYDKAIANIRRIHPHPEQVKIVIVLRNPVDRAFSQYMHKLRDGAESLSFEEALEKADWRRENNWHFDYQYLHRGMYYEQVKGYMDNFPSVKIYLSDDLRKDSSGVVNSLEDFLEIDRMPLDFGDALNVSGEPKVEALNKFLKKKNPLKSFLGKLLPQELRRKARLKVQSTVYKYNLEKKEMSSETREQLGKIFHDDVLKLQDLIDRDLSAWMV